MRTRLAAALFLLPLLAACGGGATSAPDSATFTKTRGNVVSVNGQSSDVAGVGIDVPATSASAASSADGSFDLGSLPAGVVTVFVTPPPASRPAATVAIPVSLDLTGGGEAEVHLRLDDDDVVWVSVEHCDGSGSENETRASLTPVVAGLEGRVRVRRDDEGRQGFDVEAEHLAPGTLIEVFVIDPAGASESQGTVAADALGEAELELRTNDGARLPFGVADVADLEGFGVEVRDASTGALLLQGTVPGSGSLPACGSDDDGDSEDGEDDDGSEGEARLAAEAGVAGTAEVELRSRPERGEEKIEVHVTGAASGLSLEVWLEDPANPGVLTRVGPLVSEGEGVEFERDTRDGETLPYGVPAAVDLVGLAIEVRNAADGAVLFRGTTPPLRAF